MAVQCGVLFFDGRPTEQEREGLTAGLEPLAPDGVSTVALSGIAMAFGACHVWTREDSCRQPLRTDTGLIMTWDGRLDNRDDLLLRLSGRLDSRIGDGEIALRVFQRWGIDGLRLLIGDWSLAIWDSRANLLHLARDYMGVRPLYYHVDSAAVMWSTSLGELAVRSGRIDDLNDEFVARFMTLQFSAEVTPYKAICAVPTAICVSFSREGVETRRRFWTLEPGQIRYRDPGQYEEHLRALWSDAVGSRLRTTGTAWAELSGGLDSSSVACMADALIRDERVPAADLKFVSHVTLDSPEGDERRFISEVEGRTRRDSAIFGLEMHEGARGEWDWETPLASKDVDVALIHHVRTHGGGIILTGRVGDVIMGCYPDLSVAVLDDVVNGHLTTAAAALRRWSRTSRKPYVELLANLVNAVRRARRGDPTLPLTDTQRAGVDLLVPELRALVASGPPVDLHRPRVRWSMFDVAARLLRYGCGALSNIPTPPCDVIYSHAFAHRPLVEFMLAIPASELSAPGTTRSVMRRAFAGLLPARVLARESKGYYPPSTMRLVRTVLSAMPPAHHFHIVKNGWLAAEPLAAAIRDVRDGSAQAGGAIRLALLLEQWVTTRHRRGPAAIPQRKEVTTNAVLNA